MGFFGVVDGNTAEGDKVCIFPGAQNPLSLHPLGMTNLATDYSEPLNWTVIL
jgi:hypothetical protein